MFAGLAIFISCLGLFGMASFMAEQRAKEIGARKVLGASAFAVWQLLSKNFAIMVFISIMIASPVAYYFMPKPKSFKVNLDPSRRRGQEGSLTLPYRPFL
ncbi:ABC transporter permease [Mucilaginibacter phyllosphaerae]|uniref:ABC transporter permease n=1 Tax=Mucilaginibacter phyllosphaerae TaxID=1812349 RepID=UPI00280520ED|nr:FtsX-like permease family protein [Mucilaginibacter phyllosphaerae]